MVALAEPLNSCGGSQARAVGSPARSLLQGSPSSVPWAAVVSGTVPGADVTGVTGAQALRRTESAGGADTPVCVQSRAPRHVTGAFQGGRQSWGRRGPGG